MIGSKELCATLPCVLLLAFAPGSYADQVTNERELALLPEYCRGTKVISRISKLPKSAIDNYYKIYGETYHHLHHYCWALMSEYNAYKISAKGPRNNKLNQAIGDIDYVLNKNPSATFAPLGDIYNTRARILFKMDRPGEALADLIKATSLQPAHQQAYAQLSDYYLKIGQKDKAISVLEQGAENHHSPTTLLRKLEKLGKPYQGTPGSALIKKQEINTRTQTREPVAPQQSPLDSPTLPQPGTSDKADAPATDSTQTEGKAAEPTPFGSPSNPYCRFCP